MNVTSKYTSAYAIERPDITLLHFYENFQVFLNRIFDIIFLNNHAACRIPKVAASSPTPSSGLQMEALCLSETSMSTYKSIRRYNPQTSPPPREPAIPAQEKAGNYQSCPETRFETVNPMYRCMGLCDVLSHCTLFRSES
jgi:hypothetical protein